MEQCLRIFYLTSQKLGSLQCPTKTRETISSIFYRTSQKLRSLLRPTKSRETMSTYPLSNQSRTCPFSHKNSDPCCLQIRPVEQAIVLWRLTVVLLSLHSFSAKRFPLKRVYVYLCISLSLDRSVVSCQLNSRKPRVSGTATPYSRPLVLAVPGKDFGQRQWRGY